MKWAGCEMAGPARLAGHLRIQGGGVCPPPVPSSQPMKRGVRRTAERAPAGGALGGGRQGRKGRAEKTRRGHVEKAVGGARTDSAPQLGRIHVDQLGEVHDAPRRLRVLRLRFVVEWCR